MKVRLERAGRLGAVILLLAAGCLMVLSVTAVAQGQWWTSDPATEEAKKRLYNVKGIRGVFFHRDNEGVFQPLLVVNKMEFSEAQQKAACEIIWTKFGINSGYEYQGYLEYDQMFVPVECSVPYPDLAPKG